MVGPFKSKEEAIEYAWDKVRRGRPDESCYGWGDNDWAGTGSGWRVGLRRELERLRGARDIHCGLAEARAAALPPRHARARSAADLRRRLAEVSGYAAEAAVQAYMNGYRADSQTALESYAPGAGASDMHRWDADTYALYEKLATEMHIFIEATAPGSEP